MDAIVIENLQKVFRGKRGKRVAALQGVSFSVKRGEVFGFLGPNGAGKSTTIKCLLGLIAPTGGAATIAGEVAGSLAARKLIGYLPENPAFYDYLTAQEYLGFVGNICRLDQELLAERIGEILNQLQLWDARKRPIRSYSKGMVQRLGLAQALLHDPDVYILDEPMSGLDPLGRALVKEIIKTLKEKGKTVFFSTHITADVEVVCDRVGVIEGGKLRALDRVDDILRTGTEGYVIQGLGKAGGIEEHMVEKEGLQHRLQQLWTEGFILDRIEPKRRDLEAFFLDVVARSRVAAENGPGEVTPAGVDQ